MNQGIIIWSPGVTLENIEEQVIKAALVFYRGSAIMTANALGVSEKTIRTKMEKYVTDDERARMRNEQAKLDGRSWLARARGQAEGNAIPSPAAGVRVEPAQEAPAERAVSVPQPQEIQKVLPKQASSGGARGRR